MVYEERLLDSLERSRVVAYSGDAWRLTFSSQNPLRPNVRGARWNPPDVSALYASPSERTARAEFVYIVRAQPLAPHGKIKVHKLHIQLERVIELDLRDLEKLGVQLHSLPEGLEGQLACREIGGAVAFLGFEGLIVPSIRDLQGTNLVIYADQVRVPDSAYELVESVEVELAEIDETEGDA